MSDLAVPRRLKKNAVTVPGVGEWIDWCLYDTQTYTDNSTVALDFFLTTSTNLLVSNMETAGQMPGQKVFLLRGLGVSIVPTTSAPTAMPTIDDVQKLVDNGVLRLNIGSKEYGQYPLYLLPGGGGVSGQSFDLTNGTVKQIASNGDPDIRNCYALVKPLLLTSNLNFNARIEWASAQNISANMAVRVLLFGELGRPIQ